MPNRDRIGPALAYLEDWLAFQQQNNPAMPGLSVAIAQDGDVLFERAWGSANLAAREPLTPRHLFRVASHSKTFTSAAVLHLADAGRLGLDDPVIRHLPWLAENPDSRLAGITLRQLMSHAAGVMRDGARPDFWLLERDFPDRETLIEFFRTQPLVVDPGTRMKYSNFTYGLLGLVIEAVSGLDFACYLKSKLLDPLGLAEIGPEYQEGAGRFVTGYFRPSLAWEPIAIASSSLPTNALAPATGVYASAAALCRFYDALVFGDVLLSAQARQEMLRKQWTVPLDEFERDYAHGLVLRDLGGRRIAGHSGSFPGQVSATFLDPAQRLVVSLMTNGYNVSVDLLQTGIWSILDLFEGQAAEARDAGTQDVGTQDVGPAPLAAYRGRFFTPAGAVDLVPLGEVIYVANPGKAQPFAKCGEIRRDADGTFRLAEDSGLGRHGEPVDFVFAPDGSLERASLGGFPLLREAAFRERAARVAAARTKER